MTPPLTEVTLRSLIHTLEEASRAILNAAEKLRPAEQERKKIMEWLALSRQAGILEGSADALRFYLPKSPCKCFCHTQGFAGDISTHHCCN